MIIVVATSTAEAQTVTRLLARGLPASAEWQVFLPGPDGAGAAAGAVAGQAFAYRMRGVIVAVAPEAEALFDNP